MKGDMVRGQKVTVHTKDGEYEATFLDYCKRSDGVRDRSKCRIINQHGRLAVVEDSCSSWVPVLLRW